MESLITIETVPIKIEFVEREPLKLSSVHATEMKVNKDDSVQQIQSKPIRISVQDYYEPSMAYQWENSTYTAIPKYDQSGNLQLDIQMEDGQSRAIRFKQANRSIESMTNQVNSSTADVGSMQISIPVTQLSGGMPDVTNFKTEFLPPDLELVVTQRADVIIKYVGGPIYVPPSADPNYTPPLGFEKLNIPVEGVNLDQKA
jgi:hypothetical protein